VSVRVVEVVCSSAVRFSGDQGTLACLAALEPVGVVPLIYDLGSNWRTSYPQYKTSVRMGDPRGSSSRRFVEAQIVLSHDGRLAALSGDLTRLRVFETRTGRPLWALGPETIGRDLVVTCMAFDDDGRLLVTGDSSGRVRVWDATGGRLVSQFPVAVGFAAAVGFHPDAETVAIIAGNEDAIRFWKHAAQPAPASLLDHGDEVWGLAFTRAGTLLVSIGDDHQGKAWDLTTGKSLGSYAATVLQSAVAMDRAGNRVVIGDFDGVVTLRQGGLSGSVLATSHALQGTKIRAVALSSATPGFVVAGGSGPHALIATVDSEGKILQERLVDPPHRDIYSLALAPDEKTLVAGSHDRVITLWDVPGFRHRATLNARAPVACVACSPDGKTLVSGDTEGGLQFWNMPEGTLRTTMARASETGGVWTLAFSPDGKTLATGGDDQIVRLWDTQLDLERIALSGHEAKVHAVAFSPDG
jgi:WD40 repeat protein